MNRHSWPTELCWPWMSVQNFPAILSRVVEIFQSEPLGGSTEWQCHPYLEPCCKHTKQNYVLSLPIMVLVQFSHPQKVIICTECDMSLCMCVYLHEWAGTKLLTDSQQFLFNYATFNRENMQHHNMKSLDASCLPFSHRCIIPELLQQPCGGCNCL